MIDVTEVRIRLVFGEDGRKLLAYASIVIDDALVVRDLKILNISGRLLVAMPARMVTDHCPACNTVNAILARYCCHCGTRREDDRAVPDADTGRLRVWGDVAYPLCRAARRVVDRAVLDAYHAEVDAASRPGYVCRYALPDHLRRRGKVAS